MRVRDVWAELHSLFEGEAQQVNEIELVNLDKEEMRTCLRYLMTQAKDCNCRFLVPGTEIEVSLSSLDEAANHVAKGNVSLIMWLTLPGLSMLSVYIDYTDEISFGYVTGAWNAMDVLAFFDLMYQLTNIAPKARLRPNPHIFSHRERKKLLDIWQDYANGSA